MKISKSLATDVAKSMAKATIGVKIDAVRKEMSDKSEALIKNLIPESLLKCFQSYPDYFKKSSRCLFKADGMKEIAVDQKANIPSQSSWNDVFIIERSDYEYLLSKETQLNKLLKEKDVLVSTFESTLVSLSTLKRVEDNFPESIQYFPSYCFEAKNNQISLPLEDIKKMLKKYQVKQ